jgi:hypothetical protein
VAAAIATGAAAVLAQGMRLDQERIADLLQLDRRVAHVALAHRDRRRLAVLGRSAAPAAAENVHQQEAAAVLARAVERAAAHVALVRRRDLVRQRGRQRLQDRVDHGRQRDAPQAERRGRPRAQHGALGQDHVEGAKASLVDVKIGRGETLEGNARGRDAAGAAGIDRALRLRIHLGEVDGKPRALDLDAHLDAQRLVEIAPVIVEQTFRDIDAVTDALDHLAHRTIRLIPDFRDAGLDGRAAIAIE